MNTTGTRPDQARPRWLVPALLAGGVLLAVVLALTKPWGLWIDQEASETLPTITGDTSTPADDQEAEAEETEAEETEAEETSPTSADDEAAETQAEAAEAPPTEPSPTPSGPVELATGSFISRDHTTTGRVAIVRLEDGSRVLTIEDLRTDNGPDLYVYLDDDAANAPEGDFDDGLDLGRLRGNVGDLVYEIPADVDLDDVSSVAIWCDRFSSLFGAADLVAT